MDSHTEWHAKDPDRLYSPADFVTAAHTQPKPGVAFLHHGWFSRGARCTYRVAACISTATLKMKGRHLCVGVYTAALGMITQKGISPPRGCMGAIGTEMTWADIFNLLYGGTAKV